MAAGLLIPLFGIKLTPTFGALAMSLSSFCVVTNALRINTIDIYDGRRDKKRRKLFKKDNKENLSMTKQNEELKKEMIEKDDVIRELAQYYQVRYILYIK